MKWNILLLCFLLSIYAAVAAEEASKPPAPATTKAPAEEPSKPPAPPTTKAPAEEPSKPPPAPKTTPEAPQGSPAPDATKPPATEGAATKPPATEAEPPKTSAKHTKVPRTTTTPEPPKRSLEEKVVKKKDILASVLIFGTHLNVWQDDTTEPVRYFVTPVGVLNTSTIRCDPDYINGYVLNFHVHVWQNDIAEVVKGALIEKDFPVDGLDILPLPMMEVRAGVHPDLTPRIQMDTRWRANENQPNVVNFQLYTEDGPFCDQMVVDAKNTPNAFLALTKLYYEFKMSIGSIWEHKVGVSTLDTDKPVIPVVTEPPPVNVYPPACDLDRYYELIVLINAGTDDPVKYKAWVKELADLIVACKGQI